MSPEIVDALSHSHPAARELLQRRNSGFSGVIGPDGRGVGQPLIDDEGIVYAEIDLGRCVQPRQMHDIIGHYKPSNPSTCWPTWPMLAGATHELRLPNRPLRFGQIVPSSTAKMETEIPTMLRARELVLPERFSLHSSRMRMKRVVKAELEAMDADRDRCAALRRIRRRPRPAAFGRACARLDLQDVHGGDDFPFRMAATLGIAHGTYQPQRCIAAFHGCNGSRGGGGRRGRTSSRRGL